MLFTSARIGSGVPWKSLCFGKTEIFLKPSDFFSVFPLVGNLPVNFCFVIGCSHLPHSSEIKADEFSVLSVF